MSDTLEAWWTEVHEVRPAGDEAAFVSITVHAKGKGSGAVVAAPIFQVVSIRDGAIVSSRDFTERDEALEAAGLSE